MPTVNWVNRGPITQKGLCVCCANWLSINQVRFMHLNDIPWHNHLLLKWSREKRETSKAALGFLSRVTVWCVCACCNSDLPWHTLCHEAVCEWKPSLYTTLTTVPTRHSPNAFLWMAQLAIWMKTLNKLSNSWRHVPRGWVHINTTWALALVLCMCRGTEEPIRMLFLSTHKKENYS